MPASHRSASHRLRVPRRRASRHRGLAVTVAVLALAASACGSTTVATVNGEPIDRAAVTSLRTEYRDAPSASGETFRQDLTGLIVEQAVLQQARDDFGIEFTDAEVEEWIGAPPDRYAQMFAQMAEDDTIDAGMIRANAVRTLVGDAVVGALILETYGGAERLIAEAPQDVVQVCARHILVGTEAEADEVLERLDGGEPFENLVAEVSMDTSTPDGLLAGPEGCPLHLTPLGPDFALTAATTPEGEVAGPIQTQFGFHVIIVDERRVPTVEELEADVAAFVDPNAGGNLFGEWFTEVATSADVEVSSMIGTWSATDLFILPPSGGGGVATDGVSGDPFDDVTGDGAVPPVTSDQ